MAETVFKPKAECMDGVYAMNHVLGCSHGCKYPCNAYLSAKKLGQVGSYEKWCEPKLAGNVIELLEKELAVKREEPVWPSACTLGFF